MSKNDVLNIILKPTLPHRELFFNGGFNPPGMNLKISFFANVSLNMHIGEKSFKQKLFLVKYT